MYTEAELAMLRALDPGAVLPGVDTPDGNPLAASALKPLSSISTNPNSLIYYNAAENVVSIRQAGAVLSGYDFGSAKVMVYADNVTIKDSSFEPTSSTDYFSVQTNSNNPGTTIENCTFTGPTSSTNLADFIIANSVTNILNNSFIDTPAHAINVAEAGGGVISGNYFEGAGFVPGAHVDAIEVQDTGAPLSITNNFIDWTPTPGAAIDGNEAIRITTESGNTSNVTVSGNYVLGGLWGIFEASAAGGSNSGTFSNVNITGNYVADGVYGDIYTDGAPGVNVSGNTTLDWSNPIWSTEAWQAYRSDGIKTKYLITATSGTTSITASANGATTLYGANILGDHLTGDNYETVFIGGTYMWGGAGANIFTFLAPSDSTTYHADAIGNFDVNKDVIDLSAISTNFSALLGPENFSFIGTAAFTGSSAQVRYEYVTATNMTDVEVALAGDTTPDMEIRINGLVNLTAANFALTSAQSATDLTAGAALTVQRIVAKGGASAYDYTNVQGKSYSSFEEMDSSQGALVATAYNNANGSGTLNLFGNGLTVIEGAGTQSVQTGSNVYSLASHTIEVINANGATGETFEFTQGFGNDALSGFAPAADTLELSKSTFSYLNASMTQAQDLAAVLLHATSGGAGLTIADSHGDQLTLSGVTAAMLSANAAAVKFI